MKGRIEGMVGKEGIGKMHPWAYEASQSESSHCAVHFCCGCIFSRHPDSFLDPMASSCTLLKSSAGPQMCQLSLDQQQSPFPGD